MSSTIQHKNLTEFADAHPAGPVVDIASDAPSAAGLPDGLIFFDHSTRQAYYTQGGLWHLLAGQQGASGSTGFETVSAFPEDPYDGQAVFPTTTGQCYVWYDGNWYEVGAVVLASKMLMEDGARMLAEDGTAMNME